MVDKFLFHPVFRYVFDLTEEISLSMIYEKCIQWCEHMGYNKKYFPNQDKFSREINQYGKSKQVRDKINKGERYYIFLFNEQTTEKFKNIGKNLEYAEI